METGGKDTATVVEHSLVAILASVLLRFSCLGFACRVGEALIWVCSPQLLVLRSYSLSLSLSSIFSFELGVCSLAFLSPVIPDLLAVRHLRKNDSSSSDTISQSA